MATTSNKGTHTYILMIDIDCPNAELGMKFFQDFFDGDSPNSPNKFHTYSFPFIAKPILKTKGNR
jgi:hypothetical protein